MMISVRSLILVSLVCGAAGVAGAQAPAAPQVPPAPQQPTSAPTVAPPRRASPPPAATPTTGQAAQAPVPAQVRAAPARPGLPLDSARPAVAAAATAEPANAIARCADGTFVVPPSDASACANRGGARVIMPGRGTPPAPVARAVTAQATVRAAPVPAAAPPAGATMLCRDGTYLSGAPSAGRCDANGGLVAILPAPRAAPPPPVRRP
jgi:hypothetical protein